MPDSIPLTLPATSQQCMIAIGDVNLDRIYHCPPLTSGAEQIASRRDIEIAGSAGYFCQALAKLDRTVHLLSRIGDDSDGRRIIQALREHRIAIDLLEVIPGGETGETLIFHDPRGRRERQMATYPGVLNSLKHQQINLDTFSGKTAIAHNTSYFILQGMKKWLGRFFTRLKKHNIMVSFDPNSGDGWRDPDVCAHLFHDVIPHTDFLFLNEHEATALAAVNAVEEALNCLVTAHPALMVNIKLGDKGVIGGRQGDLYRVDAFPPPGKVVDSVGAGDTFAATFLDCHLRGMPPSCCAAAACINASCTTTHPGPGTGQLHEQQLRQLMQKHHMEYGSKAQETMQYAHCRIVPNR